MNIEKQRIKSIISVKSITRSSLNRESLPTGVRALKTLYCVIMRFDDAGLAASFSTVIHTHAEFEAFCSHKRQHTQHARIHPTTQNVSYNCPIMICYIDNARAHRRASTPRIKIPIYTSVYARIERAHTEVHNLRVCDA